MLKIFVLFFIALGILSASAQPDSYNRCKAMRTENIDRFEHWLHSKQISSAVKSNTTYKIPVVVHVLHLGEPVGEGFNYTADRIESQIRTLNEDFRRKEGTPGFNSHPDGGDARIEFILAQIDPEGNATDGIVRVEMNSVHLEPSPPGTGDIITLCSRYSYWNSDQYLNIWCMDTGLLSGLFFGSGRFPVSDLEGLDIQNADGDGVFVNALNFGQGETNKVPNYDKGRTLTHEMGHFLGLLHTFGYTQCDQYSDYCEDTPAIGAPTAGCPYLKPVACDGRPAMVENYMDYSYDECMNIFTNDQISRMHIILENSPRRKSLPTSPAIDRLEEDVTGIENNIVQSFKIYPNPATDRLYISIDKKTWGHSIEVTAHTLLGKMVFRKYFTFTDTEVEIPIIDSYGKTVILTIEGSKSLHKKLVMIN